MAKPGKLALCSPGKHQYIVCFDGVFCSRCKQRMLGYDMPALPKSGPPAPRKPTSQFSRPAIPSDPLLAKKMREEEAERQRRKRACRQGDHYFIARAGEVFCEYCGKTKEGLGFASVSGGQKPLRRGSCEAAGYVWGRRM